MQPIAQNETPPNVTWRWSAGTSSGHPCWPRPWSAAAGTRSPSGRCRQIKHLNSGHKTNNIHNSTRHFRDGDSKRQGRGGGTWLGRPRIRSRRRRPSRPPSWSRPCRVAASLEMGLRHPWATFLRRGGPMPVASPRGRAHWDGDKGNGRRSWVYPRRFDRTTDRW
jgi:hypothetical protein